MTADHIPDLVLERYRLNELRPADAARIAGEISRDPRLRERLAALDRSDHELDAHLERVRTRLAAQVQVGPAEAGRHTPLVGSATPLVGSAIRLVGSATRLVGSAFRRTYIPAAVATGVVLAAVIWQTRSPMVVPVQPETGTDHIKGTAASGRPALALYRRTNDGSEQLADGTVAHAGDLIRVGYRSAGHTYGVIVSIDGAGAVTMHLPPTGTRAAALKSEPTVLLDQAYELDDAPQWERFYFVAGDAAFDAAPIVEAARDAATAHSQQPPTDLALPPQGAQRLDQVGFTLQKESRR
jgi:hypothetical protein